MAKLTFADSKGKTLPVSGKTLELCSSVRVLEGEMPVFSFRINKLLLTGTTCFSGWEKF